MSKVNRRKEIQEKEAFQLKFQLAVSQSNKHVLNWLPNAKPTGDKSDTEDRQKFMDLPVIANGQSLFSADEDDPKNHSNTVGDFLRADLLKSKQESGVPKDPRSGSQAMSALMNRMRTDKRKSLAEEKYSPNGGKAAYGVQKTYKKSEILAAIKKPTKKSQAPVPADDSDEEVSKMSQIIGKKKTATSSGKKGKARPF